MITAGTRPRPGSADGPVPGLPDVHAVYQPVVDLQSRAVVGFEALARGPVDGALHTPDALFAAARHDGRVVELDWACRSAALAGAVEAGLPATLALFVNVEPAALGSPVPPHALPVLAGAAGLAVVMEITERALTHDPAGMLRAVADARARGWRIALDDVGADRASLALLPFLRPDVVKLDLRLIQAQTNVDTAEIITAVNAEAQRTGALVLAEGIETERHAQLALSMGARLGQGWLFGRPAALPGAYPAGPVPPAGILRDEPAQAVPLCVRVPDRAPGPSSPWALVSASDQVRRSAKPLLSAISRQLERQALAMGDSAVVFGTFQHARHFSAGTGRRYATLAAHSPFTAAFATGLPAEPARGVRGVPLSPRDPLTDEWDVVVVGPHFAGALLARDLGDGGPDAQRRFDYLVTYDRTTVLAAAALLMHQVPSAPDRPAPIARAPAHRSDSRVSPVSDVDGQAGRLVAPPDHLSAVLTAAVAAAPHGVAVADALHPDYPLLWVNEAFTVITGYSQEQVLGRNCRFLQGDATDREAVRVMGAQLRAGRATRMTVMNYRRDGTAFWNDLQITPVFDREHRLTHYVGQQNDVTERIHAQQRADYLASHDPLTGLANRAQLDAHLSAELSRADRAGTAVAVLYVDIDHFKAVNDTLGHAAGDRLLAVLAARLRAAARGGDLLGRIGGDEFVLVVSGVRDTPQAVALERANDVVSALLRPLALPGRAEPVTVSASVGISLFPHDATGADELLNHADRAMYEAKAAGGNRVHLYP